MVKADYAVPTCRHRSLNAVQGGKNMQTMLRVAIGMIGVLMGLIGVGFLLAPEKLALAFYIEPIGSQGLATIRADFPGFFIGAAAFAVIGAWTRQARPLLVPLLLVSIALFGRFVSLALDGRGPAAIPPMVVEAVMIVLLVAGWRHFDKPRG
jgi:hypothetical protein